MRFMIKKIIDFFAECIAYLIVGVFASFVLIFGIIWQLFDDIFSNKLGFYIYGKK